MSIISKINEITEYGYTVCVVAIPNNTNRFQITIESNTLPHLMSHICSDGIDDSHLESHLELAFQKLKDDQIKKAAI